MKINKSYENIKVMKLIKAYLCTSKVGVTFTLVNHKVEIEIKPRGAQK